jgi:hypothetical protein
MLLRSDPWYHCSHSTTKRFPEGPLDLNCTRDLPEMHALDFDMVGGLGGGYALDSGHTGEDQSSYRGIHNRYSERVYM